MGDAESCSAWRGPEAEQVRVELTTGTLRRVGIGSYRIVFGSPRWVVKRDRNHRSTVAIVLAARLAERIRGLLGPRLAASPWLARGVAIDPTSWRGRTLAPVRRLVLMTLQGALMLLPAPIWEASAAGCKARQGRVALAHGDRLARERLERTGLTTPRIELPPISVQVRGHRPFTVTEAFRRVDVPLLPRLRALAADRRKAEVEALLAAFLDFHIRLWRLGVFTTDIVHLANYGVLDGQIVLFDNGSLTDDLQVVERFLNAPEPKLVYAVDALRTLPVNVVARFRKGLADLMQPATFQRYWLAIDLPRLEVQPVASR
jgi:hypothetical protein